jgi:hypothetical protein
VTPPKQPQKKKKARSYQQHGLTTVQKALAAVGDMEGWLSEQGEIGRALKEKRDRLIQDQGGRAKISEGELMTIDGTITAFVIQQSIGRFIGNMQCPVNKVKRALFPVVREWPVYFQAVRDGVKDLNELRIKRPKPEPISLPDYVKSKHPMPDVGSTSEADPGPTATTTPPASDQETTPSLLTPSAATAHLHTPDEAEDQGGTEGSEP